MKTAEDIRKLQMQLGKITELTKDITECIYSTVNRNPSLHQFEFKYPENVINKLQSIELKKYLEYLGYVVELKEGYYKALDSYIYHYVVKW